MKTTAAILVETGQPLELVDLEVPPLKPGQVLVEVAYSGVCHTQLLEARGYRGEDKYLPHCLGHEGSGKVVDIGSEVSKCRPGDEVILSWMKASGADVPGSVYAWNDQIVNAGGVTTFMTHTVVSENRVTPLPTAMGLRAAALLGCAVATGVGAVWNTAAAKREQSVAVFGTGGIGLCAVAGAAAAGMQPVIGVDVNPSRLQLAQEMGATHTVLATSDDVIGQLREATGGELDVAVEASGRPEVMRQALEAVRPRGGKVVVIGNARHGERLEIDPGQLNLGKRLLGTWGGDNEPDDHFPRYAELIASDQLKVESLLSDPYSLADINQALDDLEAGRVARPLVAVGS